MKLTVVLITYNHERFLRQALDSVYGQKTNFDWELIVTEDCSTDGTRDIINEYKAKYPERTRVMFSERNQNDGDVLLRAFRAARGEYIAWLDGDDYWTDERKLQKQVDFMDAHPDFSVCCHPVEDADPDGKLLNNGLHTVADVPSVRELVAVDFIASASAMYRRSVVSDYPSWTRDVFGQDWALHIFFALHGNIRHLNGPVMAVHRVHGGGVREGLPRIEQLRHDIATTAVIRDNLPAELRVIATRRLADRYCHIAQEYRALGREEEATSAIRRGLAEWPRHPALLLLAYTPGIYGAARSTYRWMRSLCS